MEIIRDISYSDHFTEYRKMDWFIPLKPSKQTALLFIHGGGWYKGNKEQWHDVCAHFASEGYICATASYRLVPQFRFPAQIEDVRLAMQHMKTTSEKFGFDADRIVVVGSSAGGHLASLLGTIQVDDLLGVGDELHDRNTLPYAVIGYCPVVTMFDRRETIENLLGFPLGANDELYQLASPVHRLVGNEPPFLLLHGDKDTLVPLDQVTNFHEQIMKHGGRSHLVVLPGVDHGFGYGVETEAQQQSIEAIEHFLRKLHS
ncbi:alpha/beta hydrolase [Paenibacillus qinlingensis]|uniref:Acetyl esterase/lipase n=1 Tax=Paenibacillus qinlingensis TaxID=1837343 RepID=A0ABU1NXR3_9BACL|nr:alpha/beta hydrolase [Paenibacillus qinlingensis]MDR6551777.1 acetyl esterase/lipase [Paenibacillus qinlingensis]